MRESSQKNIFIIGGQKTVLLTIGDTERKFSITEAQAFIDEFQSTLDYANKSVDTKLETPFNGYDFSLN